MPSAEDLYQFRHMVLQQAAYELQPISSRARLHRLALDLVEQAGSPASELAQHAFSGLPGASEAELAALALRRKHYLRQAAEDALEQFRNDESLQFLEQVAQTELLPAEAVENDCRIAEILYRIGRGALAVLRAETALSLARTVGDPKLLARAYSVRGIVCMDSARNAEAETHLRASIEIWRGLNDPPRLGNTLAQLSSAVWLSGRPDAALPLAIEAVEVCGGTHLHAQINIVNILMQLGRMDEAKTRAEPLRAVLDDRAEAYTACMLANTFGILHDYLLEYDSALAYYEKVCIAARAAGLQAELARGLTNLGGAHAAKREFGPALARQTESEALALEIGDWRICWYAVRGQADALAEIGDHRSAIERNLTALRIADQAVLPDLAMQARVAAGECFLALHQPEDAAEIVEVALTSSTGEHQPQQVVQAHAALARAYHRLGRDGSSELHMAESLLKQVPVRGREQADKSMKLAREEVT